MSKKKGKVRRRSTIAVILAVVVVLFVLLGSFSALAGPPWSDATNAWWMSTYGVSEGQVATVVDGFPDGTVRPGLDVTRAQFAKMAVDGLGGSTATPAVPTFRDVPRTNYFYPWIEGGVASGIISGFADQTFGPNSKIIRQQAYSILGSYLAQKELSLRGHIAGASANYPSLNTWYLAEGTAFLTGFADASRLAPVHAPTAAYLIYQGVVKGTASGGTMYLRPGDNLTRGAAVALILRVKAVQFVTTVPTVTSLDPNNGPAAGGNNVVITGTNFTGAMSVMFGAKSASFVVSSSTKITAAAPSGTLGTTVDVTVTTPAGTSATSAASKYIYGLPTITKLDPAAGPSGGGNNVVITGTGFNGVTAVKFGTKDATSYTVNSSTQITAKAPSGTPGTTVDVTVVTTGGTSEKTYNSKYSYGPPTVAKLTPAAGVAAGGTEVVITGTGFTGVTAVKFGTKNAVSFQATSPTSITAVAPSGAAGSTVDVTVTTPAGTSVVSVLASKYSYGVPTVTKLEPNSGPVTGGNQVVITGTCFTGVIGAGAVKFGTKDATSYVVDSPTQITAVAPSGTGVVDVRVTNPVGTSAIVTADKYTYGLAITSVSPNHGPIAGGNLVEINGSGFTGATSVTFGTKTILPASFTVNATGTKITLLAPSGTSKVDIRVNVGANQTPNTAADDYTYAPSITALSPTSGSLAGGNTVTITGSGFTGAKGVYFGTVLSTSFTVVSDTQLTVKPPAHAAATVNVTVVGLYDTSVVDPGPADDYTYAAPVVSAINPNHGPAGGGNQVTITGSNFNGASSVAFGAKTASIVNINAAGTQITVVAPSGTAETTVDVAVTVQGVVSADTANDNYTYDAGGGAAPTIVSIFPIQGPTRGGTVVTIKGTNFLGATGVTFGGVSAARFRVIDSETISVYSPRVLSPGTVEVFVTTPFGTNPDPGDGNNFTYFSLPL
jgi:hypothetical protein